MVFPIPSRQDRPWVARIGRPEVRVSASNTNVIVSFEEVADGSASQAASMPSAPNLLGHVRLSLATSTPS
jgi:hypothetical protein